MGMTQNQAPNKITFNASPIFLRDIAYLKKESALKKEEALQNALSLTARCLGMKKLSGLDLVITNKDIHHTQQSKVEGLEIPYRTLSQPTPESSLQPFSILLDNAGKEAVSKIRNLAKLETDADAIRYAVHYTKIAVESLRSYIEGQSNFGFSLHGRTATLRINTPYDRTFSNDFRKICNQFREHLCKKWDSLANGKDDSLKEKSSTPDNHHRNKL